MALPQGINFRKFLWTPVDGANEYAEFSTSLNYPTPTPQGNNVGWESGTVNYADNRNAAIDARLAGTHGFDAGSVATYRIDLPSPGSYTIRIAAGSATTAWRVSADLYDGATLLRTLVTDQAISSGQFVDATDTLRTDAADWVSNNASITETFATTILRVTIPTSSSFRTIAHIYVEAAAGGGPSTVPIGQASETDSAFALTSSKASSVLQAVEADSAFSFSSVRLREILQAVETDTAFAVTGSGGILIGQAVETDTAFSLTNNKLRSIVKAVETDTVQPVTWLKLRTIGQAIETDESFAMAASGSIPISLALEADTAQVISRLKALGVGQASESGSAFSVTGIKWRQTGQAIETDAAFTLSVNKQRSIGLANETDESFPFSSDGSITVIIGVAVETGSASGVGRIKSRAIAQGIVYDTAFNFNPVVSSGIGQSNETDSASPFSRSKFTGIGQAIETDSALIFTSDSIITVRAPSGSGYSPGRVVSVRPAQRYPTRIH